MHRSRSSPKFLGVTRQAEICVAKEESKIVLTRLEGDIMRCVWSADSATVRARDVLDLLNEQRDKPLAYNTVQTMLEILRDKGVVEHAEGPGRGRHYRSLASRDDVSRDMVGDLVERLYDGEVQPLLHHLIDGSDLSAKELDDLRQWVEEKMHDAQGDTHGDAPNGPLGDGKA